MDRQICTTRIDLERMLIDESAQPQALPLSLLDEITNGFSEEKEIGRGGFAVVYKGILGTGTVAVKKLSHSYMHEREYQREVECLMKVRHKNIVRFLGYCADTQGSMHRSNKSFVMADVLERLLCFEYVPKKSLQDHINVASRGIEWRKRYRIIKGVCEGLNYLHNNRIVHLDLKPGNILMDDNMEPKIADFGLSRCFDEEQSKIMATKVCGTMGYMPPEFNSHEVRPHYDIYSLGVIIIEILTGKKGYQAIDEVLDSWRNRLQEPVEDAELEQIRVCFNIGKECIEYDPAMRPSIRNILNRLKQTESADEPSSVEMSASKPTERGLLDVHKCQLRFPLYEPEKLISSPLRLTNNTNDVVAFRCLPKLPESFIDGLSKLHGVMPPKSTRTFLVWMEKQPPENMESFDVILESCVAHKDIHDPDDNFLPTIRKRIGGKVHQVPLVAVCDPAGDRMTSEPIQSQTKIICRTDPESYLVAMDVHPTEPWILVGHNDGHVSIWNYETQAKLVELQIVQDSYLVRYCIFIAREHWIVAGDGYGDIHVRSCETFELDEVKKFKAHTDWIQAMAVHPSLPLLLSGSSDSVIKLWDWEKDWTCIRTFKGHKDGVEALMFNPQDDSPGDIITFASASHDCTAKIWDTSSPLPIADFDCEGVDGLLCVDYFLSRGDEAQYIIAGSGSGEAYFWNLRTHKCVREIKGLHAVHGNKVRVVDCLPDPPLLITSLEDYNVGLCDSTTLRYKNTIGFGLGVARNFVYVKGIRSVIIGFEGGLAILEID